MELDRERIADIAMDIETDLHLLFKDQIKSLIMQFGSTDMQGASLVTSDIKALLDKVDALDFSELHEDKWLNVLELPDFFAPLTKHIESLIEIFGQCIVLSKKADLQQFLAATDIFLQPDGSPKTDKPTFLLAIAETAAKQAMAKAGVPSIEFKQIHSSIDAQLSTEHDEIAQIIRKRMYSLLGQ